MSHRKRAGRDWQSSIFVSHTDANRNLCHGCKLPFDRACNPISPLFQRWPWGVATGLFYGEEYEPSRVVLMIRRVLFEAYWY